ncbi:pirin family protein [Vibrio tubiashii]|uniref:pirin family protein n=1 Tax=Vibrio tubiashii TaxID=29498 RepID=UPI001EFDD060|nr:pirin family protein [Vibrio tubiashii]MCG9580741.1 pirin family protein [Vibrio tubiashii]MCG9614332.1 pirin family protein [Vibrio tubiashii]MCG9689625.1 pirin family protein [Vibrio tubiashii]
MNTDALRIIDKEDLPLGGFAGIVETRMAMNPTLWPQMKSNSEISHGLSDFIYLADGYFKPNDGAPIHPHKDVDIVSFITSGSVGHKGSLGDGTIINGPGVQVQRAGTGMEHAEFSVSDEKAGIIQIWFTPPKTGLTPDYQNFTVSEGQMTTVLGDKDGGTFDSTMSCQIGYVHDDTVIEIAEPFVVFVVRGTGVANGRNIHEGQLIEGEQLHLKAQSQLGLVLITIRDQH